LTVALDLERAVVPARRGKGGARGTGVGVSPK
jgi:hypothetical protein